MGRRPKRNHVEAKMVRNLDELARYEEFKATVAPALQKDLQAGMDAEEIIKKYKALVAARVVTAALLEPDHAKAATVGDKVLDRALGKAIQKQEIEGTFTHMSNDELDALLMSSMSKSSSESTDEEDPAH